MTDSIDVPNEDLHDALDIVDEMGYSRNVKDYWQASLSFSTMWFEGLTGYEVVDILHEFEDNGIDANLSLPF